MLNALLMLGSTNKNLKKINYMCVVVWMVFMLMNANFKTGFVFTIVNFAVFFVTFILGQVIRGKYSNNVVSVFSILIWSILIDTISYFMYPQFSMGQNILLYVGNGVLFNLKYVLLNALVLGMIYGVKFVFNKVSLEKKEKVLVSSI